VKIVDVKSAVLGTAWRNLTFVQVITDEGLIGVGEVRMLNHTDALRGYLAEAVPNHMLGYHRPGAGTAGLQAAWRGGAGEGQGIRQRLVHGGAHSAGVPRCCHESYRERVSEEDVTGERG
jgi:L-alanine-DL-glutamate epimerase-like enolase superfamily enzyme